ncbi:MULTISPECIES: hypothetical protein [unclassified Mesorhizobium]|uniref:hypothetical protein n=1 Tax=unclassified Mesorhizobium TaxID=325217 RepID=UPI00117E42CC|nr:MULTISPECIES: hypothetical protein [unclassified Mesorhizobium]
MAEVNHRDFPNPRSYVPSCADKGSLVSPGASEPVDFSLGRLDVQRERKSVIEAGLLLAVPISVAITSLIAVFALAGM